MLLVVSGADRVGKSTLIENMWRAIDEETFIQHHSAPPRDQENILDVYQEAIDTWEMSGCKHAIFDRAWPCTHIYEQLRNKNAGFLEEVIDFEMNLRRRGINVVHIGQFRQWCWSAPKHLVEVDELLAGKPQWAKRAEYLSRMQEHEQYSQMLLDFYDRVTMFPSLQLQGTPDTIELLQKAVALCE